MTHVLVQLFAVRGSNIDIFSQSIMVVHFDLFGGFLKNWFKGLPLFHEPQNTLRV